MPIDVTPASRRGSTGISRKLGVAALVMVAGAALSLRWGHAPAWNFVDLTDSYFGGVERYATRRRGLTFNYPPYSGAAFVPLAVTGLGAAKAAFTGLTLAAYGVSLAAIRCAVEILWSTTLLVCLVGPSLEPAVRTIELGQIGVILVALVLADLFLLPPRFRGIQIGLAAGIKLTPPMFVLWCVLRRDWASVARSAAAVLASIAIGWMVAAVASQCYWLGGFENLDLFGDLSFTHVNQSMTSLVARASGGASGPVLWVTATLVAGLVLAAAAVLTRRGSWPGVALTLAGATLLLSLVSWAHHRAWVAPLLAAVASAWHGVVSAVVALAFYAAPRWFVPESESIAPAQVVIAHAYLLTTWALLVATIIFPSIGRSRPARTQ